jgi:NTE family protein
METTSFFSGLTSDERATILGRLTPRRFPADSILLAEGDGPSLMYAILDGSADILIRDRSGKLHRIASVGSGDTVGEMSLLTGDPISATVRATSEISVAVLTEIELQRILEDYPVLYRNLGALLSERLAESNRRTLRERAGVVTTLVTQRAPALLGYALAGSVAWHTRKPTAYVRVASSEPPDLLARLGRRIDSGDDLQPPERPGSGAAVLLASTERAFGAEQRARTIQRLQEIYDHVLIEHVDHAPPEATGRTLHLISPSETTSRLTTGERWNTIQAWNNAGRQHGADAGGVLRVPEMTTADADALAGGWLPYTTPAGAALGWAARDLAKLKVGLALGAGSIRGYAHVGILRVLERIGLPIDCLAGTSIGAAVASTYALGHGPDRLAEVLDDVGSSAFRLTLPRSSVLSMSGVRDGVQRIGGNARFEDLTRPLGVVAADIVTGREIVFTRGLLWPAVLASMAIPGIYPSQRIREHVLVDGGVLNPVPSSVAAGLGADMVIAVKLATRDDADPLELESGMIEGKSISVVQAIMRSIEMMQGKIVTNTANAATILIEPNFGESGGWGLRSFKQGRRLIDAGEASAEAALPRLEATLPWLRA